MSNQDNKNRYMIQDMDRQFPPDGAYARYYPDEVKIYDNSNVTPLIDGNTYFEDLFNEILNLQVERLNGVNANDQGIYLANWVFEDLFTLPNGPKLTDLLKDEAIAGVDVKVLLWVNDYAMDTRPNKLYWLPFLWYPSDLSDWPVDSFMYANVASIKTYIELTSEFNLADKVMLNTLDYPAGGCHMKFALVFGRAKSIGYTGGIDFGAVRKSDAIHDAFQGGSLHSWHDVQVKVEGDAFEAFFDFYKSIWNELIDKYSQNIPQFLFNNVKYPAVQIIGNKISTSGRDYLLPVANSHSVQSLRTIPNQEYRFSAFTPLGEGAISFAPYGVYEIQLALKKAIANAEQYIYIEDQAVVSREILGYLNEAVRRNPELKVIILTNLSSEF